MALSPAEAVATCPKAWLTPEELAKADKLEQEADKVLATEWDGGSDLSVYTEASTRVVSEICRRFTRKGWIVRFEPSMKDPLTKMQMLREQMAPKMTGYRITMYPSWPKA